MANTQTCIDVVFKIIADLPEIDEISFVSFDDYDIIQNRIDLNPNISEIIDNALQIRSQLNLPFWDSFNVSLFNKEFPSFNFLKQVKFHNSISKIFSSKVDRLPEFFSKINLEDYLTINSAVKTKDNEIKHIPLLDFHIPVNSANQKICTHVIKNLNLKGYLLVSGKSFHFYGNKLLDKDSLINLLSNALLFSPIIDRAWVAHQLIERSSCLRISKKYSTLPYLVAVIE